MNKVIIKAFCVWLFTACTVFAASDPVSWALVPATGFPATKISEQSIVYYTLTNRLPFAVRIIIDSKVTGGSFALHDECHNVSINPGKSCVVVVAFKPTSAKKSTFQLIYGYNKNRIPLPVLTAQGVANPLTDRLRGVIQGLPPTFHENTNVDFEAVYTNTGTATLTGCTATDFTRSGVQATVNTGANTCNNVSLNPGDSCVVNGSVSSLTTPGIVTINSEAQCTGPAPTATSTKASTLIKAPVNVCVVHSRVDYPLPSATYKYADNIVSFVFENECTSAVTLGPISIAASGTTATITKAAYSSAPKSLNNCAATLAAGAECKISASIIPSGVGNLTVTASATPTGKASTSAKTSATVASNIQAAHHIVYVNQCKFPVWYGISNGGNANCPGPGCQTQDPNLSRYPSGAPASAYYLAAHIPGTAPATIDLVTSSYQNGAMWPRTGCAMNNGQFNCATGTCETLTGSGTCVSTASGGPLQPESPYSKLEMNFVSTAGGDGVYDISIIDGMTVPVEMKGFGPSTGNTASTVYNCAAAGAPIQPASNNKLGNCSWSFNPALTMPTIPNVNNDFYWVTPGAENGCTNGPTCGMAYSSPPDAKGNSPAPIYRRTGNFLGFNALISYAGLEDAGQWGARNLFDIYNMGTQIAGQTSTNNYGTALVDGTPILLGDNEYPAYNVLFGLPGITNNGSLNSCYQIENTNFAHCGGCVNWSYTLPAIPCGQGSPNYDPGQNLDWTTIPIENTDGGTYTPLEALAWLKIACPTAYTYPYDDPTSSFQCNQDRGTSLITSYQVTFCPGGLDALPAGAVEGRNIPVL